MRWWVFDSIHVSLKVQYTSSTCQATRWTLFVLTAGNQTAWHSSHILFPTEPFNPIYPQFSTSSSSKDCSVRFAPLCKPSRKFCTRIQSIYLPVGTLAGHLTLLNVALVNHSNFGFGMFKVCKQWRNVRIKPMQHTRRLHVFTSLWWIERFP